MADAWFPRLSPTGAHVAQGSVSLSVDGVTVAADGMGGPWLDEATVLYRRHSDGALRMFSRLTGDLGWTGPVATHVDARSGRWVAVIAGPAVLADDGRTWVGCGGGDSGCAICDDGTIGLLRHSDGAVFAVLPGTQTTTLIAPQGANIRACGDALTWQANGRVYGWRRSTGRVDDLTALRPGDTEFWPVPFGYLGDLWVLTFTQHRCQVRPWGSTRGVVVSEGETFYPDAAECNGALRVVWSSGQGVPVEVRITPGELVDLTAAPVETWTASPVGTLVPHLWRFCVGGSPTGWVRDGSHRMDCYRQPNAATFCKFGSATSWEYWGLAPDGTVWHLQDASSTGGNETRGQSYAWSNGRWLNATMRVGERIENRDNQMRWYRDGQWTAWQPHPFAVTLDAHETCSDGRERCAWSYWYGPSLAVREVYVGDSDLGWWSWTLHEAGATHHSEWPIVVNATPTVPVGTRVPWPAQRPIVVTPPVEPEKPPVPSPIIPPPRNEVLAMLTDLRAQYPSRVGHQLDDEGIAAWLVDTYTVVGRLRNGLGHEAAMAATWRAIDNVVNPPQHTSSVVGTLKVG
jgi:hypothetical protein